jgi:hypothetical protein
MRYGKRLKGVLYYRKTHLKEPLFTQNLTMFY